jgi:hypothetical protein
VSGISKITYAEITAASGAHANNASVPLVRLVRQPLCGTRQQATARAARRRSRAIAAPTARDRMCGSPAHRRRTAPGFVEIGHACKMRHHDIPSRAISAATSALRPRRDPRAGTTRRWRATVRASTRPRSQRLGAIRESPEEPGAVMSVRETGATACAGAPDKLGGPRGLARTAGAALRREQRVEVVRHFLANDARKHGAHLACTPARSCGVVA